MPRRRVNLMPREVSERRRQRRLVLNAIAAGGAVLLLLVMLFAVWTFRVGAARHDLDTQKAANAQLQRQIDELAQFDQLQQQVKEKTDLVAGLTRTEIRWSVILADISLVIPSDAWLTSFTGTVNPGTTTTGPVGSVLVNGVTFSHLDVATWLTQLAGVKEFLDPYLSLSQKAAIGMTPVVNFTSTVGLSDKAFRRNQAGGGRQL